MKRLIRLIALLIMIFSNVSPVLADRYGVEVSSEMFDRPGNLRITEPTSFLVYYTTGISTSNLQVLGPSFFPGIESSYHLECAYYPLGIAELRAGVQLPMVNFGPRRYTVVLGAVGVVAPSEYINSIIRGITAGLYGGVRYEEELSYGLFLDARALAFSNLRYPNGSWPVRLSAGLTWYYDSKPVVDSTTKLSMVSIEEILQKYSVAMRQDVKEDRTEKIKEISDVSKGIALRLPKFVVRGKTFSAYKEFGDGGENIASVACKIDTISNKLYPFKKLSDTSWQARIPVPKSYELPQINITLYVKRKDGSGFEEYITTLVEP